jgi:hypothetical protein
MIVEGLRSKITNLELREKFSAEHIAKFFTHLITGNEFFNNLEVKDLTTTNKIEVRLNFYSLKNFILL